MKQKILLSCDEKERHRYVNILKKTAPDKILLLDDIHKVHFVLSVDGNAENCRKEILEAESYSICVKSISQGNFTPQYLRKHILEKDIPRSREYTREYSR